tara:strand:- start:500 stop:1006 length:507 start_codon:yes stop_codon:yes gene_type:complete
MKKPELLEICKQHGYDTSGTKPDIIDNIMSKKVAPAKPVKSAPPNKTVAPPDKDILAKLKAVIPPVLIKRNEYDNFEHVETKLVFNRKTTEAIGVQLEDGSVRELTRDDISICNKYNFKYVIPSNLSTDTNQGETGDVDDKLDAEMLNEDELIDDEDEESEEEIEYYE